MPWKQRERSEIVHIVVTGYQKMKYPRKYYVFVIDVTWNNSDRFEIYRRYSDFFSFQTTLKALFPSAAGRRNEERVIPALPKRIFVGRSHLARVAEARLEQINRYCQTLVSLEPKVSESAHVIGFFSPRIGDKQLPKLHLHRPASLHPLEYPAGSLFEEYCALADYEAEDDTQVSFKSGDKVFVMSKDQSGWWMCQRSDHVGWAPPSYLKKCCNKDSDSDSDDDYIPVGLPERYKDNGSLGVDSEFTKDSDDSGLGSQSPSEATTPSQASQASQFSVPALEVEEYKAIDSYEAEGPGQISFEEGDIITVVDKIEDGWWFVSNGQEEGWAPCSYLEPLNGSKEDDTISSLDIQQYTTVDVYTADEDDEMSFPKGITVDVLQKSLDGWWLIKYKGKTGLAPATFLKKGEESEQVRQSTLVSPQSDFQITKAYQQPPRKQSVRLLASQRREQYGKNSLANAFAGAYKNGVAKESQLLTSKKTSAEKKAPESRVRPTSPNSSDSEDSSFTIFVPRSPRSPRPVKSNIQSKIRNFEKRSASESSLSAGEDGSSSPKPPVSPRTRSPKPQVRPKPSGLQPAAKTPDELDSVKPKAKQNRLKVDRKIPEISEPPANLPKLSMPPRPRESEIRRAYEKANITPPEKSASKPIPQRRSPSPSPSPRARSPLGALVEESGEDSDASGKFNPQRLRPPKNGRVRSHTEAPAPSPTLTPPPKPSRNKTVSEGEAGAQASSLPSSSDNPFSQQMADAMIKYILASRDPDLKEALKRIISSDPDVMSELA